MTLLCVAAGEEGSGWTHLGVAVSNSSMVPAGDVAVTQMNLFSLLFRDRRAVVSSIES